LTQGNSGDGIQSDGSHLNSSIGESAQILQLSGFFGLQTKPGLQPHVRSDLGSMPGGTAKVFVGAAQEITDPRMVVRRVTVLGGGGGLVMVTGGIV
jgi:hypothetical protein